MQKLSALALGIAILGATGANAAPTFVLKNVQFTDGASIVGSFTTNDALTIVTNWNVTTGPGATSSFFDVPGTTTGASYAPAPIFFGVDFSTATLTSTAIKFVNNSLLGNTLTLDFSAPLSSAGTTIAGGFESIPFSLGSVGIWDSLLA